MSRLNNKNGQLLGRKGLETRQRLMDAAQRLVDAHSPFALTAVGIAKEANTASATFYVYFEDVQDILFALSEVAGAQFEPLYSADMFHCPATLERDAETFVARFNRVWDGYTPILLYRNLEADRGNARFFDLRAQSALPMIQVLANAIGEAHDRTQVEPDTDTYAEAVVIFAAMERLAASTHQNPDARVRGEQLRRAQVNVIVRLLQRN